MEFKDSALGKAQTKALKRLRAEKGLTQEEAAKRVGDFTTQWQRYEWAERPAPIPWIRKVEQKLNTTLDIRADHEPVPAEHHSEEVKEGLRIAARRLHALAQAMFEEAMAAPTTLRAPASADEVRTVMRGAHRKGRAG